MKKIVIVLIVAYLGIFAFRAYQRLGYNQNRSDQQWQYFKKVIFGKDIDVLPISSSINIRLNKGIIVDIEGHPTEDDLKTIKATASQLNKLIIPKRILFTDPIPYVSSFEMPVMHMWFWDRLEIWPNNDYFMKRVPWPKNVFSKCTIWGYVKKDSIIDRPIIVGAAQFIRSDSTSQVQRNKYIVKGMMDVLLGLSRSDEKTRIQKVYPSGGFDTEGNYGYGASFDLKKDSIFNYNFFYNYGNSKLNYLYSDNYKNSLFNSTCNNCTELTEIDKYIIKTYYSPDLDKIIKDHNETSYFESYATLKYILLALCSAIILSLYFSGFFGQTLFSFVNNLVKNNWLAFNFKTLSILLIPIAIYILSLFGLYYLSYPAQTEYIHPRFHLFLFDQNAVIIILIAFILILANGIYLIENVVIIRFEQFALQQFFSFMFFVSGIIFGAYLLNRLFVLQDNIFLISFYVGSLLGLTRFLFNYSNYQKKLVLIDKEKEIIALRELKTRAELNALQSKITPHFLYNALNSIAGLAHENADKVEQMAIALSKLFRYSINKEETDFATIQNEAEMVAIYLEIEKVRFEDRLHYSIDIADDLLEEKIPMFIIQPLVENAIKHGIANVTGKATLSLTISRNKNQLLIKVSDNGPAFPEDLITGFGLHAIYEKLDILYPGNYEIKMHNGEDKNISILLANKNL